MVLNENMCQAFWLQEFKMLSFVAVENSGWAHGIWRMPSNPFLGQFSPRRALICHAPQPGFTVVHFKNVFLLMGELITWPG